MNSTKIDVEKSVGVLLTNLGTPVAPTPKALRHYLKEFLSDPRIVETPRWQWWPILYGIVLPFRSRYSARLYQKIWNENGSPLLHNSRLQAEKLQDILSQKSNLPIQIALGMRYGTPSIAQALEQLQQSDVKKIIVFPLYPQYSAATTGSTFDAVGKVLKKWCYIPQLHFINHYADHPGYIQALAHLIDEHWQLHGRGQKLLFSFHGIPQRSVDAGDPYYALCHKTASLVAKKLGLTKDVWMVVFQSRFGPKKWLKPYCDQTLKEIAHAGFKTIDIICPGFSVDCLETLEEIVQRNQKIFLSAGGSQLNYIPALNDRADHLTALADIAMTHIGV